MSVGRSQLFASSVAAAVLQWAGLQVFARCRGGGGSPGWPAPPVRPPAAADGAPTLRMRAGSDQGAYGYGLACRTPEAREKKYTIVVTVWGCPCTRADMADDRALHCTQRARSLSGFLSLMVVRGRKPPFLTSSQVE
jgi:hypothetical protein